MKHSVSLILCRDDDDVLEIVLHILSRVELV